MIYRTDVCQLTLGGTEGGGVELNTNRGVSAQKVAYLCSNSLTPSVVQRSGAVNGQGTNWELPPVIQPEGWGPPHTHTHTLQLRAGVLRVCSVLCSSGA